MALRLNLPSLFHYTIECNPSHGQVGYCVVQLNHVFLFLTGAGIVINADVSCVANAHKRSRGVHTHSVLSAVMFPLRTLIDICKKQNRLSVQNLTYAKLYWHVIHHNIAVEGTFSKPSESSLVNKINGYRHRLLINGSQIRNDLHLVILCTLRSKDIVNQSVKMILKLKLNCSMCGKRNDFAVPQEANEQ